MAASSADAAREMAYVDLHFHLLPGVDDGPGDMDASLELARAAVAEGTDTVVATPHVRARPGITDPVEIHARVLELRFALAAARIPLEVRCGGELGHELVGRHAPERAGADRAGADRGALAARGDAVPRGRPDFHEATAELRDRGFGVLVAHPERSADASLDGAAGLGASSRRARSPS